MKRWVLLLAGLLAVSCAPRQAQREVVVYVAVDQVFSEPVLKRYEQETGVRVKAVYDVEASKSTGLANRILAEKDRPKADVFWNGEVLQTLRLKEGGVLRSYRSAAAANHPPELVDPDGFWTGTAPRLRVWVARKGLTIPALGLDEMLEAGVPPKRMGISTPLFGTGATQAAALYRLMGADRAAAYYQSLLDAGVQVLPGNSTVRDRVVAGDLDFGIVDSDDACVAVQNGSDIQVLLPKQTLLIPGTVALVKGGPNPGEAEKLADYLLGAATEKTLIEAGLWQMPLGSKDAKPALDLPQPDYLKITPAELAENIEAVREDLQKRFVR